MDAVLDFIGNGDREPVRLVGTRIALGKEPTNDVVIDDDREISRLHAVLERIGERWCVRDLASTNGTYVNGERLQGERPLVHGDEIRIGSTRLVMRDVTAQPSTRTTLADPPPELTARELDVLRALCAPILGGDVFTEPASTHEIAVKLGVSDAAVKQHLANMYRKFDIADDDARRRITLANAAVNRGAVSFDDLRDS
ncbi:MAG: FHA domain-containing protein [Nitriliruptorales bacterium]|nr:FHA domain-containing protein [Nitriliruptorales bacterium]